jgi:single-stranded DNA-specific DHH superfamily exonuclease
MAGYQEKLNKIREQLDECKRPLFLFDDDPDGLCSFLLFYKYKGEGKGVVVKSSPQVGIDYLRKIEEYSPDRVFVLDKPLLSQDFIDGAKIPVTYIDHHDVQKLENVTYFNPKMYPEIDATNWGCTTYWCYRVVDKAMWVAMAGCISDWFIPPFEDEFIERYPDLLPKKLKSPDKVLFETEIGKLGRIMSMILKGDTKDVMACVRILTRINDPYEILSQTTSQGRHIFKRYEKIITQYNRLVESVNVGKEKLIVFTYQESTMSFTGDLSNDLLYRYPKKVIIIAREKSSEMKCSIRSSDVELPSLIQKALNGVEGYGGGHKHACGACIKVKDFDLFIENFTAELKEHKN